MVDIHKAEMIPLGGSRHIDWFDYYSSTSMSSDRVTIMERCSKCNKEIILEQNDYLDAFLIKSSPLCPLNEKPAIQWCLCKDCYNDFIKFMEEKKNEQ